MQIANSVAGPELALGVKHLALANTTPIVNVVR